MVTTFARFLHDWDVTLHKKAGGATLLAGLDVYYDFTWKDMFGHGRATFPNGQRLALLVKKECPAGKTPCLLLTARDDAVEGAIQTDTHYVSIVRIHSYLEASAADHAVTYLAKGFRGPGGITALRRYEHIIPDAQTLDDILDSQLHMATIRRWVDRNPKGIVILREIIDNVADADDKSTPPSQHDLAEAIAALSKLTPELCNAMVTALQSDGPGTLRRMAHGLAGNADGRQAVGEALANQINGRIADVRSASRRYREMLANSEATETDLQEFIGKNPWLLGMEYVRVLPKQEIIRGQVDFLVERHDGYHDLLELKGPNHEIIRGSPASAAGPQAPSQYALGPELSQALAQVQLYREQLTKHDHAVTDMYGISNTRHPRVVIVIGRACDLSDSAQRILGQLNRSLHRMEVMPYDVLADRADAQLNHMEKLLTIDRITTARQSTRLQGRARPKSTSSDSAR